MKLLNFKLNIPLKINEYNYIKLFMNDIFVNILYHSK